MREIKSCPFCGSKSELVMYHDETSEHKVVYVNPDQIAAVIPDPERSEDWILSTTDITSGIRVTSSELEKLTHNNGCEWLTMLMAMMPFFMNKNNSRS